MSVVSGNEGRMTPEQIRSAAFPSARLGRRGLDEMYVRAFCAKGLTPEQRARADVLARIKPYVQAWYGTWHENMLDRPFYRVNSRV